MPLERCDPHEYQRGRLDRACPTVRPLIMIAKLNKVSNRCGWGVYSFNTVCYACYIVNLVSFF